MVEDEGFLSNEQARIILDDAENRLNEFLNSRSKMVNIIHHQKYPFDCEYHLEPLRVTDVEWEGFHRELYDTVGSITSAINNERELSGSHALGDRVFGEPVYREESSWLMRDLRTGKIPSSTRQQKLKVFFYVPHKLRYR